MCQKNKPLSDVNLEYYRNKRRKPSDRSNAPPSTSVLRRHRAQSNGIANQSSDLTSSGISFCWNCCIDTLNIIKVFRTNTKKTDPQVVTSKCCLHYSNCKVHLHLVYHFVQ